MKKLLLSIFMIVISVTLIACSSTRSNEEWQIVESKKLQSTYHTPDTNDEDDNPVVVIDDPMGDDYTVDSISLAFKSSYIIPFDNSYELFINSKTMLDSYVEDLIQFVKSNFQHPNFNIFVSTKDKINLDFKQRIIDDIIQTYSIYDEDYFEKSVLYLFGIIDIYPYIDNYYIDSFSINDMVLTVNVVEEIQTPYPMIFIEDIIHSVYVFELTKALKEQVSSLNVVRNTIFTTILHD